MACGWLIEDVTISPWTPEPFALAVVEKVVMGPKIDGGSAIRSYPAGGAACYYHVTLEVVD